MAEGLNQTRCSQRKGSWQMTLRRVSLLDTHWVQLGRGLKFSILNSHLGARMTQITQRIQTKSYCPFRQWLPFSVIRLRPSSGTAIIHMKTSERCVERWQTASTDLRTGSGLDQTRLKMFPYSTTEMLFIKYNEIFTAIQTFGISKIFLLYLTKKYSKILILWSITTI